MHWQCTCGQTRNVQASFTLREYCGEHLCFIFPPLPSLCSQVNATGGKVKLVRVRNPWGNEREWTGDWSDKQVIHSHSTPVTPPVPTPHPSTPRLSTPHPPVHSTSVHLTPVHPTSVHLTPIHPSLLLLPALVCAVACLL